MVYIYGPSLPPVLRKKYQLPSNDVNDPANYVTLRSLREYMKEYNENHIEEDQFYMHEIAKPLIMWSDYQVLCKNWEDEQRPEHIKKEIKQWMIRSEERKLFGTQRVNKPRESVKDYEKSMSFGMSFIFSIFASALVGYYLGQYFLNLTHEKSLFLAAIFLVGGLLLETSLYIIKHMKDDQIKKMKGQPDLKGQKAPPQKPTRVFNVGNLKQKID